MRSIVLLAAFACGFGIAPEETGTPYPVDTKVVVTTPNGTKYGVLKANKTSGWILLLVDGEKQPLAVKLDSGISIKPYNVDKEKTIMFWKALSGVVDDLSKAKEDRGILTRTNKLGTHDFPPMSDSKLRGFATKIGDLKTESVDQKAVDAAQAIKVWLETVAETRDPKQMLAAAGEGANYNFTPIIERAQASGKKVREAREASHKRVDNAMEYLRNNYGEEFRLLALPSKE